MNPVDYRRGGDYRRTVALDYRRTTESPLYRPPTFADDTLPTYWLSVQQLANVPANISFTLVCSILLPSAVAAIVPSAQKGTHLGTAAMIGAVAQLLQPIFGAMSDRMRTKSLVCGRRRLFIIFAQVFTVVTLAAMAIAPLVHTSNSTRFWMLAWAYGFFQVANCMFCAPMGAVLPELVPVHQRGSAGGWAAFWGGISTLIGSFLGIAVGSSASWAAWVNMTSVYTILSVANVVGLWLGVIAFSAKPGCCELEAAPPLELDSVHTSTGSAPSYTGSRGSGDYASFDTKKTKGWWAEASEFVLMLLPLPCIEPYNHVPFMAMFWFNLLQGVGGIVSIYFTQYYMKDVVLAASTGFHVAGFSRPLCTTAEAATSLFGLVQSIAFMGTSLAGGYAADRLGKKPIVVISSIGQGFGFAALGFIDDFTIVLGLAVFGGLVAGLGNGAMMALQAESLPNTRDAGRDFNLLTNAFTVCQIAVPPLCGWALDAYHGGAASSSSSTSGGGLLDVVDAVQISDTAPAGSGEGAYRLIWSVAGALNVIALPLLLFIHSPQELSDAKQRETAKGSGSGSRLTAPTDGTVTTAINSQGERERTVYANSERDYWYQEIK